MLFSKREKNTKTSKSRKKGEREREKVGPLPSLCCVVSELQQTKKETADRQGPGAGQLGAWAGQEDGHPWPLPTLPSALPAQGH